MSFDQLVKSDYTLRRKEIVIKQGNKSYKFYAQELPYTQRVKIQADNLVDNNNDYVLATVLKCIVDENGEHMTQEQAQALPDDVMSQFVIAATDVNTPTQAETKKKTKRSK